MIAIVGICYINYAHYSLYRSCLPIYGIAIVRLLLFLFLDDFEGNANIRVAIKVLEYLFSIESNTENTCHLTSNISIY